MATELCSKDGILIRVMTVSDYKQVKIFMGGNFYNGEPLCASSGEDVQKCYEKENDEYHISMIEQGTCLLATEEKTGRIVGLVLAGAQFPSCLEKHRKEAAAMEPNTWGLIAVFLSKVEIKVNLFERYAISKLLYSHITNVDASMRGKGLGSRLAAALMEVGRTKGFPLMIAYCSSFYSARQKEALGMECIYEQAYADYKDDSGKVVFKPPAPHTHLRVMVIKL
ncbi:arylalkylamine N-acetyltransferase-like 2 [Drosophila grimshawi]|uniref:aralkylamine N-acetyltransferase n=1 Tax=Drosophila grimshawi TaxID=7222 RepID=B4JBR5_DROGR|nr:arylalkylamine N-acetyltransferase-like 2 [Drosophila grimshawi]EDW03000.1 GH10999 [Drosophila grimshawi]